MGIKLEETSSVMMGIKQITWIINHEHFVPGTPRKKAATANTIHISFILWKVIKVFLKSNCRCKEGNVKIMNVIAPVSANKVFNQKTEIYC